jgi:hypothetical protein
VQSQSRNLLESQLLLGEILYIGGHLDKAQLKELIVSQDVPEIYSTVGLAADQIGSIALDLGLLTPYQLFECIKAQRESITQKGSHTLLSSIMVKKGYVKTSQIGAIFDQLLKKRVGKPKIREKGKEESPGAHERNELLKRFLADRGRLDPEGVSRAEKKQWDIAAFLGRQLELYEILFLLGELDAGTLMDARAFILGVTDIDGRLTATSEESRGRNLLLGSLAGGLLLAALVIGIFVIWGKKPDPVVHHIARLQDADLRARDRVLSIQWLGKAGDPRAIPPLLWLLRNRRNGTRLRIASIRALSTFKARSLILPALKKAMKERDNRISRAAAEGIAVLCDRKTGTALFEKLGAKKGRKRGRAPGSPPETRGLRKP